MKLQIGYLISQKSDITCVFFQNYAKIKIDSYDPLPQEKILSLHNAVILIKSVFNKNQNHQKNVRINQLKDNDNNFFDSIRKMRSGEAEVAKEVFCGAKKRQ